MKQGYTHLSILIDRSGSMQSIKKQVIEGFNKMIEEQKALTDELTVSLIQFDSIVNNERSPFSNVWGSNLKQSLRYNIVNDFAPLNEVKLMNAENYTPEGGTPLNDSVARLIEETGKRLEAIPESLRPEKVIVVIYTDGEENTSNVHTKSSVRDMIKHQEEKYSWKFMYIGANQDSEVESKSRGISTYLNYTADELGTEAAYAATSKTLSKMRSMTADSLSDFDASFDLGREYSKEKNKSK